MFIICFASSFVCVAFLHTFVQHLYRRSSFTTCTRECLSSTLKGSQRFVRPRRFCLPVAPASACLFGVFELYWKCILPDYEMYLSQFWTAFVTVEMHLFQFKNVFSTLKVAQLLSCRCLRAIAIVPPLVSVWRLFVILTVSWETVVLSVWTSAVALSRKNIQLQRIWEQRLSMSIILRSVFFNFCT